MINHIELQEIPNPETHQKEVIDIHNDFQPEVYIRKGFIRKVYGILFGQLALSLMFISIGILFKESVMKFVIGHPVIMYITIIAVSITSLLLGTVKTLARTVPINYVLLLIFTVSESYLLMYVAAYYKTDIVFAALAITVACTLGLTIYAWTTKKDFTPCYAWMWGFSFILIVSGLLFFCFGMKYKIFYCGCGVLIYSIYIISDTQLILGKFQVEYNTEDYIFVAIKIYFDIINLFLYILRTFGK